MTITFVFRLWQFISGSQRFVGTCSRNAWNLSRGVVLAKEYRKLEKKEMAKIRCRIEGIVGDNRLLDATIQDYELSGPMFCHSTFVIRDASRPCGMKEKCQKKLARRVNCIRNWGSLCAIAFPFPPFFFFFFFSIPELAGFAAGNFNLVIQPENYHEIVC